MAGIALHAIQTTRVNRNNGSLHVYQIVFAQSGVLLTEEMSGLGRTNQGLCCLPGAFSAAIRVPQHAVACKSRIFSG